MSDEHILIIDDQPESIELLKVLLSVHLPEMPIDSAFDGESGLVKIMERNPALVILDVKMPGIDGFEVCRRTRENPDTADTPILMISGVLTNSEARVRGLTLGADSYICKPFEPHELIAQVRTLLRLKHKSDMLRARGRDLEKELERRAGELLKSEEKYRTLVEQLPAATYIVELGPPRRLSYISPQIQRLLGYPPGESISSPHLLPEQIHPEDRAAILAEINEHDRTGEPYSLEYRTLAKDGSVVWFHDGGVYLRNSDGVPRSIHGVLLDITEKKQTEEALRESEEKLQQAQKMEALGRLSGGVAHDFNNLLTTILGYGQMLREQIEDPALRTDLDEIIHAGERAEDLTRRLLAFGHKRVAELVPLDLNEIVGEMDRLLRRTLGNDIELVTLPGERLGCVQADEGQMSQVIMNLAVNARNAMPGGGKLTVRTERVELDSTFCASRPGLSPGSFILLEVQDTGCGIRDEAQERVFEPFFTTQSKGKGTGLGLSIVYSIVRQSAGHIELHSQVNHGTQFRIYLPAIDQKASRPQENKPTELPRGTETILVVEDEPSVRRLASRLLNGLGYRVLRERNGSAALRQFKREKTIDLVLTDVVMPHMGGPELAEKILLLKPEQKILFTTGYAQQNVIAHKDHTFPLLLKPYTRESLARAVRETLDASDPIPDASEKPL